MKSKRSVAVIAVVVVLVAAGALALWFQSRDQGTVWLSGEDSHYTLTDQKGRELTFDGTAFSGDIPVLEQHISEGSRSWPPDVETWYTSVNVPFSETFTYSPGNSFRFDVVISGNGDGWERAVDGSKIDKVTLSQDDGIVIEGEKTSFTASLNYPMDAPYSPFRITAYGAGRTSITYTKSGFALEGISGETPVTISYASAVNPDVKASYENLGTISGSAELDLSKLISDGLISVILSDGTTNTIEIH